MVLDTGYGCNNEANKRIKANRKALASALKALANNYANGKKITNKRQLHLATLFPTGAVKTIRAAARNIRCQSGVRDSFIDGLKRFNQYSELVDRVLAENNLPPEIRYLPFVESSYNPAAYSKAGAAGLWQIVPSTARYLGLELNVVEDARLDPEASTRAAARYFIEATNSLQKALRAKNPNISDADANPFIITSYNYGINGMRRAINQAGPDFMQVLKTYKSPSFRVAVKNFYASFLAARHIVLNAEHYFGLVANSVTTQPQTQTLILRQPTSLARIKKVFALDEAQLKPINLRLTRFIWNDWRLIPAGYKLALPAKADNWQAERARLATMAPEKIVAGGNRYTVRKGDTACGIARALRVNCNTLIKANNLDASAIIRIGQKLLIPGKLALSGGAADKTPKIGSKNTIWIVKKGDTACAIALYNGVSCRRLIRLNQLGRKARIYIGQKLILPIGDFVAANATGLNADSRYIVQKGDTACNIAARFKVDCRQLNQFNRLTMRSTIYPGQKLKVAGQVAPTITATATQLATADAPQSQTPPAEASAAPGNQLMNLLDTLPDLGIRVDSDNGEPLYYIIVEVDETLGHFADWLGIGNARGLQQANNIQFATGLRLGQRLVLPNLTPATVARFEQLRTEYHQVLSETLKQHFELVGIDNYQIQSGDSLPQMSRQKDFPLWLIYRLNPDLKSTGLVAGKTIKLPQLIAH